MEEVTKTLKPVTDQLPPDVQDFLEGGGWWLVLGIVALLLVLILARLLRMLFGRRRARRTDWDAGRRIMLADLPPPSRPPGEQRLHVYHVPVRLRLVVLAPAGSDTTIDKAGAEPILERIMPGLGKLAGHDAPEVVVWPAQLSRQGFASALQRCTVKPEPEDAPSSWVFVSGKVAIGKLTVLVGLGLWAQEANTLGRLNLEPHQWLDVLRLRRPGE